MPIFRRRGADRRPQTAADVDLQALRERDLLARYRQVESAVDADDDPDGRAALLDALAAEVLRRHPDSPEFWYDRGMYAKWRADWAASIEYSRRALDLLPADRREGEAAAWNLGIAATAMQDWATARTAWGAFGISLPQAAHPAEPIVADFGPAPVRLNAEPRFVGQRPLVIDDRTWDTEVVWGRRLCPTRIQILNVPTPDSGHRYGDIVLHDGDPVGSRRLGERDVSVFNETLLWRRSPVPTLTTLLRAPDPATVDELATLFEASGGAAEDWTQNVQLLCRACSEGSPAADHHHHPEPVWTPERTIGLSAHPDQARDLLDQWAAHDAHRDYRDLTTALK
jgi:hypothetical protein